jgi:AcrR family transcriptional regulator
MSKRGDDKRTQLVAAALAVIERIGLRKTTLEDVTAEARVSRSTMYYYFGSKADLFTAVIDHLIEDLQQKVAGGVDPTSPADERLMQIVAVLGGEVQRLVMLYEVTRDVAGEMVPLAQKRIDQFGDWYLALLAEVVRDGVDSGQLVVDDPERFARTLQLAFQGVFNPVINDDWDHLIDDAQAMLRIFMRGIAARPGEEAPC